MILGKLGAARMPNESHVFTPTRYLRIFYGSYHLRHEAGGLIELIDEAKTQTALPPSEY
jgi:hypothetical protein